MNAQEMFEELGYKVTYYENVIYYIKIEAYVGRGRRKSNSYTISFNLLEKQYTTMFNSWQLSINAKLHEAITQQMKELGWLKKEEY